MKNRARKILSSITATLVISFGVSGGAIGEEKMNIKIHDHIPPGDLTESPLAGKAMKYSYLEAVSVTPYGEGEYEAVSYGEVIELVWEEGQCTYLGLEGKFAGQTETMSCGQHEVAPGVYFITWLEPSAQVVSMVVNSNTMTVNTSYLSKGPRGLDNLEYLEAKIYKFGSISEIQALRNK